MAELVDAGAGTKESDYAGKDEGKDCFGERAARGGAGSGGGKVGAVGIVSYAQNQKTAWSGENLDAIRWGHLETFSVNKTFAFMVSLSADRAGFSRAAGQGEKIQLHAL
jgi:hypothetical protein